MSGELKFFLRFVGDNASAVNASKKLKDALLAVAGQAALTAASFAALKKIGGIMLSAAKDASVLTKELTRIRLTAEEGSEAVGKMRTSLKSQSAQTGVSKNELLAGYQSFAATGLSSDKINPAMSAVSKAMSVTGVDSASLANAVSVAAEAFGFDVGRDASMIIDKMYKAGKKGNAELPDLPGLVSRAGFNAASAGINIDTFLAISEQMSQYERMPQRLATLMDSTMRIFTNYDYLQKAQKATGVQFFDASGGRRNALDVLEELRVFMSKAKTDKERAALLEDAFGATDLDTQRGLRALFGDAQSVNKMRDLAKQIGNSSGEINNDFKEATNNLADQTARFKRIKENAFDKAGENYGEIIKYPLTGLNDFVEDKSDSAGNFLTGASAVAATAALILGGKGAVGTVKGIIGGLAMGEVVEKATDGKVQQVFVVNMPGGGMPGGGMLKAPPVLPAGLGGLGGLALPLGIGLGAPLAAFGINAFLEEDLKNRGIEDKISELKRMKFEKNLAVQMGELAKYNSGKFNPGDYGYENFGVHKYTPTTNVYITMSKDGKVLDTRTVVRQTTGGIE